MQQNKNGDRKWINEKAKTIVFKKWHEHVTRVQSRCQLISEGEGQAMEEKNTTKLSIKKRAEPEALEREAAFAG